MKLCYEQDGEFYEIGELPEIETFVEGKKDLGRAYEVSCTFHTKIPKHLRCKSRKRYIKLLMSKGESREMAVFLADFVRDCGYSYADAWLILMLGGFVHENQT